MTGSALTLTNWSRLLFGTLARAGVREVIVSPGSRSTPFAYAALTTEGLRCHSITDERSAAFFALGQARATGVATALVCTSGSAAAEYFPAVVEASASYTPLVILTADRPFELQECGAAQTMDQVKLYGSFVRRYFDLGHPEESELSLDALERLAAQVVAASRWPVPGPVHVNARARKPLEPVLPSTDSERAAWAAVTARLARPVPAIRSPDAAPATESVRELADLCRRAPRGLIVCGPIPPTRADDARAVIELARATGYPVCVEATSQARFSEAVREHRVIGALDVLSRSSLMEREAPELVLKLGAPPTSGAFARWLSGARASTAVISPFGHQDPESLARWLIAADPFTLARLLARELTDRQPGIESPGARASFRASWERMDRRYFALVAELERKGALDEATAVRKSVAALPPNGLLVLGNSLPVRDVDAYVPPQDKPLQVFSQRGLNGIDGLVSGALGTAQAAARPCLALIGDVSFLHDVGGLAAAVHVKSPLVIVILDNAGGRIFSALPVARLLGTQPALSDFWLTPPRADLAHAAALYHLPYERVAQASELESTLPRAFERAGVTVVHAVVEADSARLLNESLLSRLEAALSDA